MIWLLLASGCETPVGVERVDTMTAQHQLTANALTADELSPSARNVLRRWVLSERYDDDPDGRNRSAARDRQGWPRRRG